MACLLQQLPTASHLPPQALWTAHTELNPTTGASLEYPKLTLADADIYWLDNAQQAMHAANKAVHPDTGELAEYKSLRSSSKGAEWEASCANEFGRLAQGVKPHMPTGTDTIHFIPVTSMPAGRKATYLRLVTADRPQKTETKRTRATVDGEKITYPGDVSTKTAGLTTAKVLFNSVLSTPNAKFMGIDLKNFYLNTPLDRYEYMKMPITLIPDEIINQYNLLPLVHNGFIYIEIQKGMYGLPQAGILASKLLQKRLAAHGYAPTEHTHGLWTHHTRPILFSLVVDDFGVKYVGKQHADHLYNALEENYEAACDWDGKLYCGVTLDWNYQKRTVDLSMPGYVAAALHKYQHESPKQHCNAPSKWTAPQYGSKVQMTKIDDTAPMDAKQTHWLQQVVGTFSFYARAVDPTMLHALNVLASSQKHGTQATVDALVHFLNYAATHPNAKIRYNASDMVLHVHSDASYLVEPEARSRAGGHHFLSDRARSPNPTPNGPIFNLAKILRNVMSSAAEAEVGALFLNAKEATVLRTTLTEMGHQQPPTPLQTDNSTANGIINGTVKQQASKAIDMRFYWIRDRSNQGHFHVYWAPGSANLGDYFTKHHSPKHHRLMRPTFLHMPTNPYTRMLRGCVDSPPTSQVTRKRTVRPTVRQQQSRRVDIHSPRRQ